MILRKSSFFSVKGIFMIKKNLNDARYIYTLLCFIKLIKLYIESKIQHIRTAEYSHKIVLLRLIMLLILIEIKATIEFCITEFDFVQNFSLNWQFGFFSQSFTKKGISRHKQTNKQTSKNEDHHRVLHNWIRLCTEF